MGFVVAQLHSYCGDLHCPNLWKHFANCQLWNKKQNRNPESKVKSEKCPAEVEVVEITLVSTAFAAFLPFSTRCH